MQPATLHRASSATRRLPAALTRSRHMFALRGCTSSSSSSGSRLLMKRGLLACVPLAAAAMPSSAATAEGVKPTRTLEVRARLCAQRLRVVAVCRVPGRVPTCPAACFLPLCPQTHRQDMRFDNTFVRELPGDAETSNTLRQVEDALFSRVEPTPAGSEPHLVAYSPAVAALLDLPASECER